MALVVVSQTLLVLVALLAFWRGRGWERATAAVLLLNWFGTALAPPFDKVEPPWIVIGLDGAVALFLIYAALFSGRLWTIWAAAFQLLLMANHLAFVRFSEIQQWAYVTGYYVWGDLLLIALAAGAVNRPRRVTH